MIERINGAQWSDVRLSLCGNVPNLVMLNCESTLYITLHSTTSHDTTLHHTTRHYTIASPLAMHSLPAGTATPFVTHAIKMYGTTN